MNTESAFFSGGGWLSVCVVARYLSNVAYTQHWSGVLLIKVAKLHPGDRFCQGRYKRGQESGVEVLVPSRQIHVADHGRTSGACFNGIFLFFFSFGWTTEPKWSGNCGLEFCNGCTRILSLPSYDILGLSKTSLCPSR